MKSLEFEGRLVCGEELELFGGKEARRNARVWTGAGKPSLLSLAFEGFVFEFDAEPGSGVGPPLFRGWDGDA